MKIVRLSTLFIFLLMPFYGLAQDYHLTGRVVNENNEGLGFIELRLFKADYLQAAENKSFTDSLGYFSFKLNKGMYELAIEDLGSEISRLNIDVLSNVDLGNISIEQSIALKRVVVSKRKRFIEQQVDRIVFNLENSIAAQGMSGLDALKNTPLIRLQNDELSIVGKGNVVVMINERLLNLSGSDLTNYLQSLRSDDIAKIEVITTPPSKYDAAGNSGIIHIILKRNQQLGWSGTANSSFRRTSYGGIGLGTTLNYQSNKLNSSLQLRQYDYQFKPESIRNLLGESDAIYTTEKRKDQLKGVGLNYRLDYRINHQQNIGFIYDYNHQKYSMKTDGISRYQHQGIVDSVLATRQKQSWKTPTHTLNLYYDLKLDTLGKKLSIVGNLLDNRPDKLNDFSTQINQSFNEMEVRNNSQLNYQIYAGQADLVLPYSWATIETGIKYTYFNNQSDVGYFKKTDSDYLLVPENSNAFHYNESNYALNGSIQKDFNKHWSAKAGMRYEYTDLKGVAPGVGDVVKDKYGNFFPTVYIRFKPSNNHDLSINYSRRIDRPSFQSLNPFRWYTNPYIYFTGTPTLKPSYSDNVELNYTLKNKLTIGLYNQYTKDGTSNIARLKDGIYSNVIENSYHQNRVGLRLNYYHTFFNRWEASFSTNSTYTNTTPIIPDVEKLSVFSLSYSIYNTITLNRDKTWFLLLNFWHDLPYVYANIKIKDQLDFSPGVKTSFFDKRLKISAVVSDLFRTLKSKGYSYNNGYRSEFNTYMDQRRLALSLAYSFGSNQVKENKKDIQFSDKQRAN